MPGRLDFEFRFGSASAGPLRRGDAAGPMRILVIGDFSGRGGHESVDSGAGLAERRTLAVDIDNFEDLMARLAPRIELPLSDEAGPVMAVAVNELDDFHPDALYDTLPLFQALRDLRRRLVDPATFAEAAAELRREAPAAGGPEAAAPPDDDGGDADGSMLDRLLGGRPAGLPGMAQERPAAVQGLDSFIRRIVEPHIAPHVDPEQGQYVASVDAAIGDRMRAVLHHPRFQALESAWRSLHGLVTGVETGEELKLYLLDATRDELAADIAEAGDDLAATALCRRLVGAAEGPDGEGWSMVVGDYGFGTAQADVGLLAALGAIAARAGGPFLAAASVDVLGCPSLAEAPDPTQWLPLDPDAEQSWRALRTSPAATSIGLAAPCVMLRLPYGKRSDEIDRFEFEEFAGDVTHDRFLWGNPAFVCARLIAEAYTASGWAMAPGDVPDLGDLPTHVYDEGGEKKMKACAEAFLGERAADAMLGRGVMPLLSYRNRNAVRVARFQSVADPPAALSGPWG